MPGNRSVPAKTSSPLAMLSSSSRRPILPKPPSDDRSQESDRDPPSPPFPSRKREMVKIACQACRTRKTKCDAKRPQCSPCISRGQSCQYDSEPDVDRYTSLKRKHSRLEKEHDDLVELFDMLQCRSRRDALSILDRVRATDDLHSTLAFIKQGDLLMQNRSRSISASIITDLPRATSPTESFLNIFHPLAYPPLVALDDPDAGLGHKRKSILDAVVGDESSLTQATIDNARDISKPHKLRDERIQRVKAGRWTTVTDEDAVVANLISLYISWEHSTVRIFDENYFIEQLIAGEEAYCSPLLVNAILAVASLNYKAIDANGVSTLSPQFYEETERLWHEQEAGRDLLVVPTSILMDVWWKAHDDPGRGAEYLARGIKVARDLGLFEVSSTYSQGSLPRQDRKGRAVIAWGIFNWQGLDSLVVHRDDHFSQPLVTSVPHDPTTVDEDVTEWDSFPLLRPRQKIDRQDTFRSMCQFCKILHEHIDLRSKLAAAAAADKETHIADVKAIFVKLLNWADNLPPSMARTPECLPVVLDAHMFYHFTVIELFQPFIREESSTGSLAREMTAASLAHLRRILYIQRFRYGGPPLTSAIIHPIHVLARDLVERLARATEPDAEAEFYAVLCVDALTQISACYPVTNGVLRDLVGRVGTPEASDRLAPELLGALRGVEGGSFSAREGARRREARERREMYLEMAVANPRRDVMNWLEDATGELRLA